MNNNNVLTVVGPTDPVKYSIYRITIGDYVYIGHTNDIHDRANRHATDTRRTLGRLFKELTHDMHVEHIDEACSREEARELEQRHIETAREQHGDNLLNVQHARQKKK